jgi:hypothetical protein
MKCTSMANEALQSPDVIAPQIGLYPDKPTSFTKILIHYRDTNAALFY